MMTTATPGSGIACPSNDSHASQSTGVYRLPAGATPFIEEAVQPDSLLRLASLTVNGDNDEDSGTIFPAAHAVGSVLQVIYPASKMTASPLGSPSIDSKGGVRFTWKRGSREVRLVAPSDPSKQMYLYSQDGDATELLKDVSPDSLAAKWEWLVSGAPSL